MLVVIDMKILILTPILFEETSPFNHLFRDILLKLLQEGHTITRVVATDNYKNQLYKMGLEKITYLPIKRKKTKKKECFFKIYT